ncbi:hypothetical protein [Carnobacterium divergens]|uniref:hypothetical protein n=1 Tax=Carnobacterium divergens TaxID=2748 RepID=UPI001430C0C0|nr:hypothetical protein [Carnobacterium divergens]
MKITSEQLSDALFGFYMSSDKLDGHDIEDVCEILKDMKAVGYIEIGSVETEEEQS